MTLKLERVNDLVFGSTLFSFYGNPNYYGDGCYKIVLLSLVFSKKQIF